MGGILKSAGKTLWGDQPSGNPMDAYRQMNRPDKPGYIGITDSNGNILPQYKLSNGDAYSGLAKTQLEQAFKEGNDNLTAAKLGSVANSRNALASRGGLSGGAAALLESQAGTDLMNAKQGLTSKNLEGENTINMNQFDITRDAEKTNLANAIRDTSGRNAWAQNQYMMDMGEYGANQTANAMAMNSPRPKGGLIGGTLSGAGRILGK